MVANIAYGDGEGEGVREADPEEIALFKEARRHLPASVFDPGRWERTVGAEWWKRVVTVLNRGGRYEGFEGAYDGDYPRHRYGGLFSLYSEQVASARHSLTGKPFPGIAVYEAVRDASGKMVDQSGYDYHLITYKDILGGQSRTLPTDYWLSSIWKENAVLISSGDARRLGIRDGMKVKLVSATNPEGVWDLRNGRRFPVAGKAKVVEGIRPGTIAVSWHFGHWAYGSHDVEINGKTVRGDSRRATGLCSNVALMTDPYLGDVCLTDPIGGSASFYDTRVRVIKA